MRLILVFLFCVLFAFSQTNDNDSQIAYQFYQNGEYEKAIKIYKQLSKSSNFTIYYNPYFQSLIYTENYQDAERLVQRMIRKLPSKLVYLVDLYIVQQRNDNSHISKKTLDKIYSKIIKFESQLFSISNTLIRYQKYEEALECYRVIEQSDNNHNRLYNIQIAQIYQYMNEDDRMIEEYLSLLNQDPSQKNTVILYLQRYLDNNGIYSEKNYNIVRNGLLIYSQKEKNTYIFSELLIWLFLQNNEFELAFLQAKSLDKRLSEDGERIYDLAETYLDNNYYDLAIKAYDYIIEKGNNNYYFIDAKINKLYAMGELSNANLIEIDKLYQSTINEIGKDRFTVLLINNYAHFKAFHLGDLNGSQVILEDVMKIPQISKRDLSECKLAYADIMLLSGNIWTSLLYYSQVEKENKENPIGHEAKLRRAKIAYYQGDFEWAQSQLDILKSSTSKLIANDAMDLSLLITDNLNLDTSDIPMRIYARADLLYYQNNYIKSLTTLDSVISIFPFHNLTDEIYFRKYEIYNKSGEIDKAISMLEEIISNYSFDILYDDAIFNLANLYEFKKNDLDKAFLYYEMILFECSGSIYTAESRKKYRKLRGDNL